MPKFKKDEEELLDELREQILAFRASIKSYDEGHKWEAKRLSSSIYMLCHDGTGRTKSLLGMTKYKRKMLFLSSKVEFPGSNKPTVVSAPATLLISYRLDENGVECVPAEDRFIGKNRTWLKFSEWYEECLFHPTSGLSLSRKNMIFSMRTQDGGAHVDSHITDEGYRSFSLGGIPNVRADEKGLYFGKNGFSGAPIKDTKLAVLRQISWELDQSLIQIGL